MVEKKIYPTFRPFVIDLESTNGTLVNDETIPTSRYYELKPSDGETIIWSHFALLTVRNSHKIWSIIERICFTTRRCLKLAYHGMMFYSQA